MTFETTALCGIQMSVLLTGFTPAEDPRIRQIEARALAAIRE